MDSMVKLLVIDIRETETLTNYRSAHQIFIHHVRWTTRIEANASGKGMDP